MLPTTMDKKSRFINTDRLHYSFTRFINSKNNNRIIVSGAFGIGKTTFLKNYFHKEKTYLNIHLYPVNYSVSKNEDIFELIKFDILYDLLEFCESPEHINTTWFENIAFLSGDDIYKIMSSFVALIPKFGKNINDVVDNIKVICQVFKDHKRKVNITEFDHILSFVRQIESQQGSIYENDFFSKLICSLVAKAKLKYDQVFLTIDDLDRMDPDHIFRILNIFAAHFDDNIFNGIEKNNKFDFDKVILCCDLENIRNIYHNRYGNNVDFNGYINKFFSKGVFTYENIENTKKIIDEIVENISIKNATNNVISGTYKEILCSILKGLVDCRKITPRHLFRHSYSEYIIPLCTVKSNRTEFENWQIPITVVFEFIIDLYGNTQNAIEAVRALNINLTLETPSFRERFVGDLVLMNYVQSLSDHNTTAFQHAYYTSDGVRIEADIKSRFIGSKSKLFEFFADSSNSEKATGKNLNELIEHAFTQYVITRDPHVS